MTRVRSTITLLAAVALLSGLAVPVGAQTSACVLEPTLVDHTVNQGVGAYTLLAPGKQTLVRAYLSEPSCADDDDRVVLESASLDFFGDTTSGVIGAVPTPTPSIESPTELPAFALAPVGGVSEADPIFVVPGGQLKSATGAAFAVDFRVAVTYRSSDGGAMSEVRKKTFAPFNASFGAAQKPLKAIVVPLVDGDRSPEFDAVEPAVVAAMDTLNREFPLVTGTSELLGTGGVRYTIHPTGLDLRNVGGKDLLGADGKFCHTDWSSISKALQDIITTHNSSKTNLLTRAYANRALGVVPNGIVEDGCGTRGFASYPGTTAYVIGSPLPVDGLPRPATGSLTTLELAHTLGLVDLNSPNRNTAQSDPSHSKNVEADFADRAFDTHGAEPIASGDDRSVMKFGTDSGWNDDVTLFEAREWLYALCRATPSLTAGGITCRGDYSIGTSAAAEGVRFAITGYTDGTPSGTVVDTYEVEAGVSSDLDPSSEYRLVMRTGGQIHAEYGLPTTDTESHHHGDDDGTHTSDVVHIDASVESVPDAQTFELWKGSPAGATESELSQGQTANATMLHRRDRNGAPEIGDAVVAPSFGPARNITGTPDADDDAPALSPDGEVVAWRAPDGLRLRLVDAPNKTSGPVDGYAPTWSRDGRRIAFTTAVGEVKVAGVVYDPVDGTPVIQESSTVYRPSIEGTELPASDPTWRHTPDPGHPDRHELAVAIDGDIWLLDPDAAVALTPACVLIDVDLCPRVTATTGTVEADPAWIDTRLVFECTGESTTDLCVETAPADEVLAFVENATDPAVGGPYLTYVRDGAVWLATVSDTRLVGDRPVTDVGASRPSLDLGGGRLAFRSAQNDGPGDILVTDSAAEVVTVEATDPDSDDELRAVFTVDCGDVEHALTPFLDPHVGEQGKVTFTYRYDSSLLCEAGTLMVWVTDGVLVDRADIGSTGAPRDPVPAIVEPESGGTIGQYDPVVLVGGASGAGADPTYSWSSPSLFDETVEGQHPSPLNAPAGGWPLGPHEVTLTVDSGTGTATATFTVTVVADQDGDHLTDEVESGSCFAEDADLDPSNVFADPDGDGLVNAVDPQPCEALRTVAVDFEPDLLYVPSSGNPVTVVVPKSVIDVRAIDPATVRIAHVGGWTVQQPASSFEVDKKGNGIAKFDRQQLTSFLSEKGLVGHYVRIVVAGSGPGVDLRGVDPNHPITAPAN